MSDFIPVLALGIIILAVLIGIFGVTEMQPPYKISPSLFDEDDWEKESNKTESGWVGVPSEQLSHQTIGRDFSVSYESLETKPVTFENEIIKSGMFEEKELVKQFEIENPEDIESAKIKYSIHDTNLYGNIIFILNGEIIFNNYSLPGNYEIKLNKSKMGETNTIRITGENSGWKVWAPTTYIIDSDVAINYFTSKPKTFSFESIESITGARLVITFDKTSGDGNFIARINGEEIYREKPDKILIKDFSTSLLKENNKIEFLADRNSNYEIKEAEILLFYSPKIQTKSIDYEISESRYDSLKKANLTFYIETISGNVISLLVKITNSEGEHRILVQDILREAQYYSVNITKNELAVGNNKIELVSSGDGGFMIKNITVKDIKK